MIKSANVFSNVSDASRNGLIRKILLFITTFYYLIIKLIAYLFADYCLVLYINIAGTSNNLINSMGEF